MPPLFSYLIRELSAGAAIGSACWGAILWVNRDAWSGLGAGPLLLGLWGFSSLFAIGYLATSLEFLADPGDGLD